MSPLSARRSGLTLVELMIVILISGIFLSAVNYFLRSVSDWKVLAAAQDAVSEDVTSVWTNLSNDLNLSTWYSNNVTPAGGTFAVDRGQFYVPYVVQPGPGAGAAQATDPLLAIFNRNDAIGTRFRLDVGTWAYSGLCKMSEIDAVVPGRSSEVAFTPSAAYSEGTTYRTNFFAPSQELVFTRCYVGGWDAANDAPAFGGVPAVPQPSRLNGPSELFRAPSYAQQVAGATSVGWWSTLNNQAGLGVLYPSPFVRNAINLWVLRIDPATGGPVALPYGVVLDGAFLDTTSGSASLRPLLEQDINPSRTSQAVANVRLLGYQVVPSPIGFGRLVRTYVQAIPGSAPAAGVDPGQCIAASGTRYLMVDKVLSDHVVRVLFETARHDADLGINNVRATIFFAKLVQRGSGAPLILRRVVTMVFTMRGANTAPEQATWQSAIIPTGPIPFSYN